MSKFLILSLPRSRSAWMSHWLRYGGKIVGHDLAVECASIADFKAKMELLDGSCETGAVLGWRLIREQMPDCKLVVVLRPVGEVMASLGKFGLAVPEQELQERSMMLGIVASLPDTMVLTYSQLADPLVCQALWEHVLELPFDWQWWSKYQSLHIEVNMGARVARLAANHDRLEALKAEVRAAGPKIGGGPCFH